MPACRYTAALFSRTDAAVSIVHLCTTGQPSCFGMRHPPEGPPCSSPVVMLATTAMGRSHWLPWPLALAAPHGLWRCGRWLAAGGFWQLQAPLTKGRAGWLAVGSLPHQLHSMAAAVLDVPGDPMAPNVQPSPLDGDTYIPTEKGGGVQEWRGPGPPGQGGIPSARPSCRRPACAPCPHSGAKGCGGWPGE